LMIAFDDRLRFRPRKRGFDVRCFHASSCF
jgi:hypothetical protein